MPGGSEGTHHVDDLALAAFCILFLSLPAALLLSLKQSNYGQILPLLLRPILVQSPPHPPTTLRNTQSVSAHLYCNRPQQSACHNRARARKHTTCQLTRPCRWARLLSLSVHLYVYRNGVFSGKNSSRSSPALTKSLQVPRLSMQIVRWRGLLTSVTLPGRVKVGSDAARTVRVWRHCVRDHRVTRACSCVPEALRIHAVFLLLRSSVRAKLRMLSAYVC
jgi:hypothetical protein